MKLFIIGISTFICLLLIARLTPFEYNPFYYLNNRGVLKHLKNDLVINSFGDIGLEIQKKRYRGAIYQVEVFKKKEPLIRKKSIPLKYILNKNNFYLDKNKSIYYNDKYEFRYFIHDSGMKNNDDIRLIAIERE